MFVMPNVCLSGSTHWFRRQRRLRLVEKIFFSFYFLPIISFVHEKNTRLKKNTCMRDARVYKAAVYTWSEQPTGFFFFLFAHEGSDACQCSGVW